MTVRCAGCGEALGEHDPACGRCRTPALGARFNESCELVIGAKIVVPDVCCCCLAPRRIVRTETISSAYVAGHQRLARIPVPWCRLCRLQRISLFAIPFAVFFFGSFPAIYVIGGWLGYGANVAFGGVIAAGVVALIVRVLLVKVAPRRRGHVDACLACEGGSIDREGAGHVVFANRAFAEIWRNTNAATH